MSLCKVGSLLGPSRGMSLLERADRDTLVESLADPARVPATALAKALTLEGHPVSPTTIKDHRGARCGCARERTTP